MGPAVAAGLDAWEPGPEFLVYPALKSLTLDIATQVFMGGADLATPDELERGERGVHRLRAGGHRRSCAARSPARAGAGRCAGAGCSRSSSAGTSRPSEQEATGDDLFSVLCALRDDDGSGLSDADVVNHMIFLLMAAHDTSTITVTTMMRHLGAHPEWRSAAARRRGRPARLPDLDELDALESFDLVMKECLRLVPPVPVVARRSVKETEVLGVRIPADQPVAVMLHLGHHMAEYWPQPEVFDPLRFASHRREDKVHRLRLGAVRGRGAQVPGHGLRRLRGRS